MFVNDVKEKEPLPQSVEVLSHAAARAATFLVFAVMWTAFKWLRIVPRLALSILCSHADYDLKIRLNDALALISILYSRMDYIHVPLVLQSSSPGFNLMQSHGLRQFELPINP